MTDETVVDPEKLGAGLSGIRKRRWYFWSVILVYLPVMWLTLKINPAFRVLATVFVIWVILLIVVALISAAARCPRCGNYFHLHGMTLLYLRKCLHCQLHICADKQKRVRKYPLQQP